MAKVIKTTRGMTAQAIAEEAADELNAGNSVDVGGGRDRDWYRSRLAARVPHRMRKTRILAHVVLGGSKVAVTGVRLTGRVAGRHGRRIAANRKAMTSQRRAAARWRTTDVASGVAEDAPDLDHQFSRRFGRGGHYCSTCRHRYRSFEELNDHFVTVHLDEEPLAQPREKPSTERVIHRSPTTRKVRIRPDTSNVIPLRRHGVTRRTPEEHRAVAVLAKHRSKINEVGAKAMTDNPAARGIARAATDLAQQNPQGRTEMYEQVAGIEQALDALREAVERYQQGLKRDYRERKAIAAELVDPYFRRMGEALESASQGAAQFVANFEVENAAAIKLAQQKRNDGGQKFLAN